MTLKTLAQLISATALILLNIYFIKYSGTGDVNNWLNLITRVQLNKGADFVSSCLNYDCGVFYPLTYPPGHFLIIYAVAKLIPSSLISPLLSFKLSLFVFYLLVLFVTGLIYYLLSDSRSPLFAPFSLMTLYLTNPAFLINTQILGYTDIYFILPLLISFLFLSKKGFILSGFFFGISILIKWQPLILFPLFIVYLLFGKKKRINIPGFMLGLFTPVLLLVTITPSIISSIRISLTDGVIYNKFLSAGLNIPWVAGEIIAFLKPGLASVFPSKYGYIMISKNSGLEILLILPKIIFSAVYFCLLWIFLKNLKRRPGKNFLLFLKFSVLVFLNYYLLSSGVHENHLIPSLFIFFLYFLLNPTRFNVLFLLYLLLYNFFSMFIFYGFDGNSLMPNGLMNQNPALLGSIIFSALSVYFSVKLISDKFPPPYKLK